MAGKRETLGLMAFLKGSSNPKDQIPGCANYDRNLGGCVSGEGCKVEQGQRCDYFEKAVLPTAGTIGQADRIYSLYQDRVGIEETLLPNVSKSRPCPGCGVGLRPRQRYCDICSKKRRRETYRRRRKAIRKSA